MVNQTPPETSGSDTKRVSINYPAPTHFPAAIFESFMRPHPARTHSAHFPHPRLFKPSECGVASAYSTPRENHQHQ